MALEPLELLVSGRPKFQPDEVEVAVQTGVEITSIIPDTLFRLTTHRILLQNEKNEWARQIQLQKIKDVDVKPHGWINKSIHFTLHVVEGEKVHQIQFGFKVGRDAMLTHLLNMLKAKHWVKEPSSGQPQTKQKNQFLTTNAGIVGLIRTQEDKHKEIESTMTEAFSDLKALMSNAAEMVSLAERLRANHSASEENEVRDLMLEMGMVASPVTKEMAGNLFHSELARQLTDLLQPHFERNNGIMALTDVYCLYNRARGTALISPDDLYEACLLFDKLKLPLRLRRFEGSGVLALQSTSYDDKVVLDIIKEMAQNNAFPLTIIQFARLKNISVPLAKYFLIKAEEEGILCRDESYEGLIFYQNIFTSPAI